MQYNFNQLSKRHNSDSMKWRAYDPDTLPLWVADMDFVSPQPVIQALLKRVEHGIFGYAKEPSGLRKAIQERLWKLYGWAVETDDILFIPGVVTSLNLVCHALTSASQGLLVQTPVYPPFLGLAKNASILHQEMELSLQADGSYAIDWENFAAAITDQTRLFVLCNPHNPVGRAYRQDELERMAEICLRRNILICSDEIHCDLIFSGSRHIPIASLSAETAQNTITLMAPSKTFNIAGLDCSFAVIQSQALRKQVQHARQGLVGGVNLLGFTAALAAYQESQDWLDQLLVYLEANRDYLYHYVQHELPGIQMGLPEATYLAWLDCRNLGLEEKPYNFFLRQAKVALNDGATFGHGGDGFVRLNFGCPRSILEEALERMRLAVLSRAR